MTRTELIAALEAAKGPSRDLDMAIELLLEDAGFDEPATNWPEDCPHYTESIDAALSFTPEGWELGLDPIFFEVEHDVKFDAILCRADWNKWNPVNSEWIHLFQ